MKKNPRLVQPPTSESLVRSALAYLSRFSASEASLRRVLENRIRKASLRNREFAQDSNAQEGLRRTIENIIEKHRKTGALNDAAYAETKVNSLRRVGRSARAITEKLGRAGVEKSVIRAALSGEEGGTDPEETEMRAARELARRRRLGPFRVGVTDPDRLRKDMATLARAGFTLGIARRVLGGKDFDED